MFNLAECRFNFQSPFQQPCIIHILYHLFYHNNSQNLSVFLLQLFFFSLLSVKCFKFVPIHFLSPNHVFFVCLFFCGLKSVYLCTIARQEIMNLVSLIFCILSWSCPAHSNCLYVFLSVSSLISLSVCQALPRKLS